MVGSLATDFVECHADQQVPEIAARLNLVLAFLESAEKTAVNRLQYVFGIDPLAQFVANPLTGYSDKSVRMVFHDQRGSTLLAGDCLVDEISERTLIGHRTIFNFSIL